MFNQRKRKLLRIGLVLVAVLLVVAVTATSSYIGTLAYKGLVVPVSITKGISRSLPAQDAANPSGFSAVAVENSDYSKVAENETLALFINSAMTGFKVYDKRSGFVWNTLPSGTDPTLGNVAESFRNSMQSILTFKYVDLVSRNSIEKLTYSSTEPCTVKSLVIPNGIRLSYEFQQLNIKISVDFTLEGNRFSVKVPDDLIVENEKGTDNLSGTKADLSDKINRIRSACDEIKKLSAASDYSDNKKKIIELTCNSVAEILLALDEQAGTGNFTITKIDELKENLDRIVSLTEDLAGAGGKIAALVPVAAEIADTAMIMAKNRSTGITELQVIPYFGAQTFSTDGYVFYPDKNGAISYFNRKHPAMSGTYKQDVYASSYENPSYTQSTTKGISVDNADYKSPAKLPVFGIKAGESAFVGIIANGDTDSAILYNPCNADMEFANVNAQYYLRQKTVLVNENGGQNAIFDNIRTKTDREILYCLLDGEDADYSGMAVTYRDYLEKNGMLKRSKLMDSAMPLGLEFFMGVENSKQSFLRDFVTMTTFSDVQSTLLKLKEKGVSNILVNMKDWTVRNGAKLPDRAEAANQLGGNDALAALGIYAGKNGVVVGLEKQMVWAKREDMSSSFIDIAAVKNKSLLTFESGGYHMLNPSYIYNQFLKNDLAFYQKGNINALNIQSLCSSLYFDYNRYAPVDRSETSRIFANLAGVVQNKLGYSIGADINAYMLGNMDWNMYLGSENSGFLYGDEDVPFYQIVIHGSIPYTGEGFNLLYNKSEQTLQFIEYGYIPFYSLTYDSPLKMRNIGYSDFYSTRADEWIDRISETYANYKKDFGDLYGLQIQEHRRLDGNVSKTVYENNISVYVNHGTADALVEGVQIKAQSYAIVKS